MQLDGRVAGKLTSWKISDENPESSMARSMDQAIRAETELGDRFDYPAERRLPMNSIFLPWSGKLIAFDGSWTKSLSFQSLQKICQKEHNGFSRLRNSCCSIWQ